MSINLTITWSHPAAISNKVQYARIDNTLNPIFTSVADLPGSSGTATIATNIPNGQYQVDITPVYPDGRTCSATVITTSPCSPLFSLNAVIQSGNIVISYLAPSDAPKVRITVNFPNGGSSVANYVNNGNNIVIPLPAGLTGVYTVSGQTVCDEGSGFFSAPSPQVSLAVTGSNVTISNQVSGITITNVAGITGFALPANVPTGGNQTGNHTAFYGSIACTFTGTPGANSSALLEVNSTIIQCVNVPNTAGGTVTFSAASFAANDQILILFNLGSCP